MGSWPDDGALVMRWKKANEARRTRLRRTKKNYVFSKLLFLDSLSI